MAGRYQGCHVLRDTNGGHRNVEVFWDILGWFWRQSQPRRNAVSDHSTPAAKLTKTQRQRTDSRERNILQARRGEPASLPGEGRAGPAGLTWLQVGALIPSATVGQQSRLLPERHDPTRSSLNRFLERSPCNTVVTGKRDQLFHILIVVVPKLDGIR